MMNYQLVTIVLAAGESRRMGKPKIFLPLWGSTLLRLAVQAAVDLNPDGRVVVVTGAHYEEVKEHLADFEHVVLAPFGKWQQGMGASLSRGITVGWMFHPTHFLITLADQPTVDKEALTLLLRESEAHPDQIVATQYPERLGVPAIFPLQYVDEVRQGSQVFGARAVIANAGENVRVITFPESPLDVDTPEDYTKLLHKDKE